MKNFNIGIIDDDSTKVTQILIGLDKGCSNNDSVDVNNRYSDYILNPIEIPLYVEMDSIIEFIVEQNIHCVIIDYNLKSYAKTISYSGIGLGKAINEHLYEFPIFILTSYKDDLFDKEIFNAYQVFDFERYINEPYERIELNYKIIEQILKHNKELGNWESELLELLPNAGKNAEIDNKILDLDGKLEKSINNKNAINDKLKRELVSSKVDILIEKIDDILKGE